jgi:ribosomal protein L11 methyltransferase
MEKYIALNVESTDEILMALLTQFEFESFEENEDHFIAYINEKYLDDQSRQDIVEIILPFTNKFSFEVIEPQNWNALWEASFQPVIVDDFCQIRADFHPAMSGIRFDLVINPKMAFGTGHHATTYMMIKLMEGIDFNGKTIFDFGCGTGILAIMASKLAAKEIDAVDIEHESYLNTIENGSVNGTENITTYEGNIDVVPNRQYDIILANINRNILVKYAGELLSRLNENGILLFSGVLEEDVQMVTDTYQAHGMRVEEMLSKDGWMCVKMNLS